MRIAVLGAILMIVRDRIAQLSGHGRQRSLWGQSTLAHEVTTMGMFDEVLCNHEFFGQHKGEIRQTKKA